MRRLYGDLAWAWPIISPPEDYVEEAREAAEIIRKHTRIRAKTLLHMGCGGGHLDRTLKESFEVTGLDLSEDMLALARRMNPEVTYLRGDMRNVRLRKTFDAVAVFDSIDYMLTPDDLRAAFATAFRHLKRGGAFVTFAEVTKERFEQNRTRCTIHPMTRGDITFLENWYDPDPTDTTFEITFVYLIRRDGRLEVETDRHLSGLFPVSMWSQLLDETGFETTSEPPTAEAKEDHPWFVCVKRP